MNLENTGSVNRKMVVMIESQLTTLEDKNKFMLLQ
jgi:hypothetical protein